MRRKDSRRSTNRRDPAELLRPPKNWWDSTFNNKNLKAYTKKISNREREREREEERERERKRETERERERCKCIPTTRQITR